LQIYLPEACEKWLIHKNPYGTFIKTLFFEPKPEDTTYMNWHVADISGKCFQHDITRITININKIANNFPKLESIIENLNIFMCPKPSADTCNACANDFYICYFARSTQIPWCMTDYITAHELGHVVQYKLCDTRKSNRFSEYLELRNAEKGMCTFDKWDDEADKWIDDYQGEDFLYLNGTQEQKNQYREWDMNPQEWFAEDFRWFFGVDQGDRFWGMPIPEPDKKIKEFMLSL
jgi:hypothetical protein